MAWTTIDILNLQGEKEKHKKLVIKYKILEIFYLYF